MYFIIHLKPIERYKIFFQFSSVQKELTQTISDLSMLQKLLNDNQKEIQRKQEKVSELDRSGFVYFGIEYSSACDIN